MDGVTRDSRPRIAAYILAGLLTIESKGKPVKQATLGTGGLQGSFRMASPKTTVALPLQN